MEHCGQPTIPSQSCAPTADGPPLRNLQAIVRAYVRECRPRLEAQLHSFAHEPTLASAVARAALARSPEGKRYSHQHRIKLATLREAQRRLSAIDLSHKRTFEDLYKTDLRFRS